MNDIREWFSAVKRGNLKKIKGLVRKIQSIYVNDSTGQTALNYFIEDPVKNADLIKWLLEAGYNPLYPTFDLPELIRQVMRTFPRQFTGEQITEIVNRTLTNFAELYQLGGLYVEDFIRILTVSLFPSVPDENKKLYYDAILPLVIDSYRKIMDKLLSNPALIEYIIPYLDDEYDKVNIGYLLMDKQLNTFDKYLQLMDNKLSPKNLTEFLQEAIATGKLRAIRILLKYDIDLNNTVLIPYLLRLHRDHPKQVKNVLDLLINFGLELTPDILQSLELFNDDLQKSLYLSRIKQVKDRQLRTLDPGSGAILDTTKTTDWQEICRSLDKTYKIEELREYVKAIGATPRPDMTKRELCKILAEDLEEMLTEQFDIRKIETDFFKDRKCHNNDILGDEYDYLPDAQVIEFNQDGHKYCLTLEEIENLIKTTDPGQKLLNPFNREPLPETVLVTYQERSGEKSKHKTVHEMTTRPKTARRKLIQTLEQIDKVYPYLPYQKIMEMTEDDIKNMATWFKKKVGAPINLTGLNNSLKESREAGILHILKVYQPRNYNTLGATLDLYFRSAGE